MISRERKTKIKRLEAKYLEKEYCEVTCLNLPSPIVSCFWEVGIKSILDKICIQSWTANDPKILPQDCPWLSWKKKMRKIRRGDFLNRCTKFEAFDSSSVGFKSFLLWWESHLILCRIYKNPILFLFFILKQNNRTSLLNVVI